MDRIILKISGESISNQQQIIDNNKVQPILEQIKVLNKNYQIGIVIGGGNIWRGAKINHLDVSRNISDTVGMLATTINAAVLCEIFNNNGIKAKVFSNKECCNLTHPINYYDINEHLNNQGVAIFAAGTGNPYFSTDTGAALRASEINAKWIIMGKNGVDGIYSDDPRTNPNAIFYDHLTYDEILEKELNIMDLTALTICKENNVKLKVFNANEKDGYIKAIKNDIKLTIVEA